MKYAVLGIGDATESAVHEALADILKKDKKAEFLIHARRNPQGAVPSVYDFIVDNECRFVSYTRIDDKAPKPLLEGATDVVKTETPLESIIHDADEALLLWDEKDEQASNRLAFMCADQGLSIRDLTMALTPIVVDVEESSEKTAPITVGTEEDNAVVEFTREELMGMTVAVLKRQAKAMGVPVSANDTKADIVNAILGDNMPEVASDFHNEVATPVNMAVVVWYENGVMTTVQVPAEPLKTWLKM